MKRSAVKTRQRAIDLEPEVTGRSHVRKYVLRMRNRELRNIRPSGALFTEVTKSRDRNRPCSALIFFTNKNLPISKQVTFKLVLINDGLLHILIMPFYYF
jgi:hypothetical protein